MSPLFRKSFPQIIAPVCVAQQLSLLATPLSSYLVHRSSLSTHSFWPRFPLCNNATNTVHHESAIITKRRLSVVIANLNLEQILQKRYAARWGAPGRKSGGSHIRRSEPLSIHCISSDTTYFGGETGWIFPSTIRKLPKSVSNCKNVDICSVRGSKFPFP